MKFVTDKYITIGKYHHVLVASIRSGTLIMVLSNGILKFIFTDTLYIPISEANHISFGVLHYKSALA